jgi:DNA-directed RNA polymerase sigma subunit (sigma70/sigma32)
MLYEDIKVTFEEHLSYEEARAMWLRYGFDEECSSLDEVARKMGKTREEVRVLITRAMSTLKRYPNYERLYDYALD